MTETDVAHEQQVLMQDPPLQGYHAGLVRGDMRNVAYRVSLAVPRVSAWANGQKIQVRAGLFVSRAKTVAAYALSLGIATSEALDVASQLTAADPSHSDYRAFIDSVVALLEAIDPCDGSTQQEEGSQ